MSYPIIAGGMGALSGLLNSMFGGGGSQALALAGGGTWELESAGVLEGILGVGVSVDIYQKIKNAKNNMNSSTGSENQTAR